MDYQDYYKTLGVKKDASKQEIKRAYRTLARKYHPDVSKEADAEIKFKEVGEAYDVLKDPEKREAYDQLGSNWKAGQEGFQPPPDWDETMTLVVRIILKVIPKITVAFLKTCSVVVNLVKADITALSKELALKQKVRMSALR